MMKLTSILAVAGLFVSSLANPVQLTPRTKDLNACFKDIKSHTTAAIAIVAEAKVDIDADIDVRAAVAAKIKASLDAAAKIYAEVTAEIKATVNAEVELIAETKATDKKHFEKIVVDGCKDVVVDIDVIVKALGEDVCKPYTKPLFVEIGAFGKCLDGIFVGLGASIGAAINAVLGVALSLSLGLDLTVLLGLGGIIGIGRA